MVHCPSCGVAFVVAAEDGTTALPDELEQEHAKAAREQELDGLRIRQVSRVRRAAIRARSYCMVVVTGCAVGIVDLLWRAVRRLGYEPFMARPVSYLIFAVALAWLGGVFLRRANAFADEIRDQRLPDPDTAPDFSSLGDGSQVLKNLEQLK